MKPYDTPDKGMRTESIEKCDAWVAHARTIRAIDTHLGTSRVVT
jgi:hypothetical protein